MVEFLRKCNIENILNKLEYFLFSREVQAYKFVLNGCTMYTEKYAKRKFFGGRELHELIDYRRKAIAYQCKINYKKIKVIRVKL